MMLNRISKYAILIIVLLCLVSRMPQLFSENLILDGDESIVALMAKHLLELKEFPIFFYGQSYGFSFVEVLTTSLFYTIFGITDIAVKLAMLSLWTIGIIFFYKTLKEIGFKSNPWIPLLITLVFIFSPSFAVWSMKARGGYLTAFMLSSIITFLIVHKKSHSRLLKSLIIGFLIIVVYQAQPLWLAGLFPLLAYYLIKNRSIHNVLMTLLGVLVGLFTFYFIKKGLSTYWSPNVLGDLDVSLKSFKSIFDRMFISFTGSYYFGRIIPPLFIMKAISILMMSLILVSTFMGIFFLIKKKKVNPLFYVFILSVLGSLAYLLFIHNSDYRYLLPLTGYTLLMVAFTVSHIKSTQLANTLIIIWIASGMYSLYNFKDYAFDDKEALISLVDELERKEISHIFCEGGMLQWQIMFYSNEQIIARFYFNTDRYPAYVRSVNANYKERKEHTALVGYYKKELAETLSDFTSINDVFYIHTPVSEEFLIEREFDLTEP